MNVVLHRLDPNVPDPVESRRSAAGRVVRIAYATIVFGVLAFFAIYFGAPLVFLGGPGTVSAPPYIVSLPYTVQVSKIDLAPGATVKAGQEIALVISPEQDSIVATYMRALADVAGRTAELRIKARVAQESLEAVRSYMRVTEEAVEHIDTMSSATVPFRIGSPARACRSPQGCCLAGGRNRRDCHSTCPPGQICSSASRPHG